MSTVNSAAEQPAKRAIRAVAGTNLDGASAHNRRVIFDALRINGALKWRDAKTSGSYGCAPQHETDLGWRQGEINLAPYRGQRITIRFENRSQPDGWYNTWTFVDDVVFTP